MTAWPPVSPGALAGGERGGGVKGATARKAVWLFAFSPRAAQELPFVRKLTELAIFVFD